MRYVVEVWSPTQKRWIRLAGEYARRVRAMHTCEMFAKARIMEVA